MGEALRGSYSTMLEMLPFSKLAEEISDIHYVEDSERFTLAIIPKHAGDDVIPVFLTLNHRFDPEFDKPISKEAFETLSKMMTIQHREETDEHIDQTENHFVKKHSLDDLNNEPKNPTKENVFKEQSTVANLRFYHEDDNAKIEAGNSVEIPTELASAGENNKILMAKSIKFPDSPRNLGDLQIILRLYRNELMNFRSSSCLLDNDDLDQGLVREIVGTFQEISRQDNTASENAYVALAFCAKIFKEQLQVIPEKNSLEGPKKQGINRMFWRVIADQEGKVLE